MAKKTLLMILDGWGEGKRDKTDAIAQSKTPYMDALMQKYPHAHLQASGENVGLPEGQMGNSEVGHLNIGAGRVVYQDLVKVTRDTENGDLAKQPVLKEAFEYAREKNKAVHFLGLLSDGGVHSMDTHLFKLCDITKEYGVKNVFVHALMDGRDTDPRSGLGYMKKLVKHLENSNGQVATVTGRYYTMDRDKRWDRIKIGYDALIEGKGTLVKDPVKAIEDSYAEGVTDEFIKPVVVTGTNDEPVAKIQEGDVVFCFNFRTDRLRQITTALTQKDFPEHDMKTIPLHYVTLTVYDETFKGVKPVYTKDNIKESLGEVVANAGLKQIRIAETEKYAHVTFFFSGGREEPFENEQRILINSPKVATYDLQPEMSAEPVADAIVKEMDKREVSFVCLNFANGDMVGHTGVWDAIIKAIETVDKCVEKVVEAAKRNDYEVMIIADHGNADNAVNSDGTPNTAHSTNPVPCVLVSERFRKINNGVLADVAPTILKMMGVEKPKSMTGKELV